MNGASKVKVIVVSLIALSLINIVILTLLSGPEKIIVRGIRFFLTCVLGFYLIQGAPWARIVAAVLFGLGAITSVVGFLGLSSVGIAMFSLFGIWLLLLAVAYVAVAYFLILDRDVAEHFS